MMRILLVEDDEDLRFGLADVLTAAGHVVVEAPDGKEGLRLLEKREPDLLITDLVMQGMEGIETILEFRRRCPDLPIIAISGNALYLKNSQGLGADATLLKPIAKKTLIDTVAEVIAARAA